MLISKIWSSNITRLSQKPENMVDIRSIIRVIVMKNLTTLEKKSEVIFFLSSGYMNYNIIVY